MKSSPPRSLLAVGLLLGPTAALADFEDLGTLPGGDYFVSRAQAVSGDGTVVVGSGSIVTIVPECCVIVDEQAIRWEAGVLTGMKPLVALHDRSIARDVSQDGSVISGSLDSNGPLGNSGFVWDASGVTSLGDLPGGGSFSIGRGVSADGAAIAGSGVDGVNDRAIRWDTGALVTLGTGTGYSYAYGISADGSSVVGYQENEGAKRWDGLAMSDLAAPPGDFGTRAFGISADGTVIVGRSRQSVGDIALRWDQGVPTLLGTLPGDLTSVALDTSGNGAVVVGYSADSQGYRRAFVWDTTNGMRELRAVLVAQGDDLTGWTLEEATGVSDDGSVVVGFGDNPQGRGRGWVATGSGLQVFVDPVPVVPGVGLVLLVALLAGSGVRFARRAERQSSA